MPVATHIPNTGSGRSPAPRPRNRSCTGLLPRGISLLTLNFLISIPCTPSRGADHEPNVISFRDLDPRWFEFEPLRDDFYDARRGCRGRVLPRRRNAGLPSKSAVPATAAASTRLFAYDIEAFRSHMSKADARHGIPTCECCGSRGMSSLVTKTVVTLGVSGCGRRRRYSDDDSDGKCLAFPQTPARHPCEFVRYRYFAR